MGAPVSSDIVSKLRALPGLIGAKELAGLLGLKAVTVYKLAHSHQIPNFRVGYSVRFDGDAVAQWLRQREAK